MTSNHLLLFPHEVDQVVNNHTVTHSFTHQILLQTSAGLLSFNLKISFGQEFLMLPPMCSWLITTMNC